MNIEFQSVMLGRKQLIEQLGHMIGSKEEFTWIFTYSDEKKGNACLFIQYDPVKTTVGIVARKNNWANYPLRLESFTFFPWRGPSDFFIIELKKRTENFGHLAIEYLLMEDIAKDNEIADLDKALRAAFFSNIHEIWAMITVAKPRGFINIKKRKYNPNLDASQPLLPMFMHDLTNKE
jgi:hypothetical protein